MQNSPPAIVLDGNQRSALAAVRSLGAQGVQAWVAAELRAPLAGTSRFCAGRLVYPDPAKSPEAFILWLEELAGKWPGAVLIPMTDLTVPLVLHAASRIAALRIALPSASAYETATDKYRLYSHARAVGVLAPTTAIVSKSSLESLRLEDLRFPVVVKPRQSALRTAAGVVKRSVQYATDARDLMDKLRGELVEDSDSCLLQEYVAGAGAGVFALYAGGEPQFFFAHRRVREKPPSGGVSVLCESITLPEAGVAATRALLDPLRWHGVAMVEFKIDSAGALWLIEINARFWGSLQLAVDCGADFPGFLYRLASGRALDLPRGYPAGRRLRWWLGDLDNLYARLRDPAWTPTLAAKAQALSEFALPWQPRTRYEFLRWNDPRPALAGFGQYLGELFSQHKGPS